MQSKLPKLWQVLRIPLRREMSEKCAPPVRISNRKRENHIYNVTFTKDELIEYIKKNMLSNYPDYIVTNVPQGIAFHINGSSWEDYKKPPISDTGLQDIVPELCHVFNSKEIFICKYPRRTSSGLTILGKSFKAFQSLRKCLTDAAQKRDRILTYLVVVLGHPTDNVSKTFSVRTKDENGCNVVEIYNDGEERRKVRYKHVVLDSTEEVSLLKISVSDDKKDFIRYILSQKFFTPIVGDFWSLKWIQNFIFGAPVVGDSEFLVGPYKKLYLGIMEKLQLNSGEEELIPVQSHFYSLRANLKHKRELLMSVPPPNTFVWTCEQLGLKKINEFVKTVPVK